MNPCRAIPLMLLSCLHISEDTLAMKKPTRMQHGDVHHIFFNSNVVCLNNCLIKIKITVNTIKTEEKSKIKQQLS